MVVKLVSMPPSQRKVTYGMPTALGLFLDRSCACFLVPTNRTVLPFATESRRNAYVRSIAPVVFCRSMM